MGIEHWRPWQCLDLSYIYALLHNGYRLDNDKEIYVSFFELFSRRNIISNLMMGDISYFEFI